MSAAPASLFATPLIRRLRVLAILTATVEVAAMVAQMWFVSSAIALVFLHHAPLSRVAVTLLFAAGSGALRIVAATTRRVGADVITIHGKAVLRRRFVHTLGTGGITLLHERGSSDFVNLIGDGIERLDAFIRLYLPQQAIVICTPLIIAAAALSRDITTAIILGVTAPVLPLFMVLIGRSTERRVQHQWERLARLGAQLLDGLRGLPTLLLFGREQAEAKLLQTLGEGYSSSTLSILQLAFLSSLVLEFMIAVSIGLVAVSLGSRLLNGGIGFQRALFLLLLTPEFYRPLRELGAQRHAALEGTAAASDLAGVLASPPRLTHAAGVTVPTQPFPITLEHVTVQFPNRATPALADVTLELPGPSLIAVVGPSGAGKSTLLSLLCAFIEPTGGEIRVGGDLLTCLDRTEWQKHIAFVPQNPQLIEGSLRENLTVTAGDGVQARLAVVASQLHIDTIANRLPRGWDTLLGDGHARLSGGEIRRVAVARALLRGSPVVLLDEPTASLDLESELDLQRVIESLRVNRLVIVVAHRLSTLASADLVIILHEGRVAAVGRHAELLKLEPLYQSLWETACAPVP
ncbi:MAG: thiol reductant ABC exporter subunit CydD [Chloroflexi bacterium]|nr:thiol reductant ABC exporter subunit CydD [Chloroflexota bacterium]